jgi:hypothetical protein
MQNKLNKQEMTEQILNVIRIHKKGTVRSIKSVTGLDPKFIEKVLNEHTENGFLKENSSYAHEGHRVDEKIWKLAREKFTQQTIF